jgi:hypothetical protein
MPEERVVKIPMRLDLIRRMDTALNETRGGFTTRADLISEAVEQFLVEISYEDAPPEPSAGNANLARSVPHDRPFAVDSADAGNDMRSLPRAQSAPKGWPEPADGIQLRTLEETALQFPGRGAVLQGGIARPEEEPLLGLHNRDYPSLWAACKLATYTRDDLLPWRSFISRVTADAWTFARGLGELERAGVRRGLTALFPTNREKRPSAERAFQSFALGTVRRGVEGTISVGGPLFIWRTSQLEYRNDVLQVGLTSEGWDLLEALDGVSLVMPHDPDLAVAFFAHLRRHARADWWGFEHAVRVVADRPNRQALVDSFAAEGGRRTPSVVSSLAQGYVARAREWGLIEPKQIEGRYWLTDFGRQQLQEMGG